MNQLKLKYYIYISNIKYGYQKPLIILVGNKFWYKIGFENKT